MWFDATGRRLPAPCMPGFDTMSTLAHIMKTDHDYSWFVLNRSIVRKEFTLSGSEQNPDFTSGKWLPVLKRVTAGIPGPVQAFLDKGQDFIVEKNLPDLVRRMNALTGDDLVDEARLRTEIEARDREMDNPFTKDVQVMALRAARNYLGDRLVRVATPHKILDPKHGPLIAVRLSILTRKSLGGLETDLSARVLTPSGEALGGVYAAGEAAGFGGGGVHGYNSLEGTFLGGCIFSGRTAGRAAAQAVG
jgi:predicted oxidoreductase